MGGTDDRTMAVVRAGFDHPPWTLRSAAAAPAPPARGPTPRRGGKRPLLDGLLPPRRVRGAAGAGGCWPCGGGISLLQGVWARIPAAATLPAGCGRIF